MDILKNIVCALGVVVFVAGLCAIFNRLLLLFVRPRCGENTFTVVFLDGGTEYPAAVISYYLTIYSVSGGLGQMKIICVDKGLSIHTAELLKEVFAHEKHVKFMSAEEFARFSAKKTENNDAEYF